VDERQGLTGFLDGLDKLQDGQGLSVTDNKLGLLQNLIVVARKVIVQFLRGLFKQFLAWCQCGGSNHLPFLLWCLIVWQRENSRARKGIQ